jgi:Domain of unknown function (DUF3883)
MARRVSVPDRPVTLREGPIVAGLYLAKFDTRALKQLGFQGFTEAFNVLGYALGSRPASIKNYRDEFDPLFPNLRKGWHKRPIRDYCLKVFEKYNGLDFESFTGLINSLADYYDTGSGETQSADPPEDADSSFAKRLITGLAAEQYFESVQASLPEFGGYSAENTTRYGCGYDYRLRSEPTQTDFLAVEVKGLKERSGSLSLTPKEYDSATMLKERFFLFVVKNFQEVPFHEIFRNPIFSPLNFRRTERKVVQVSWLTTV